MCIFQNILKCRLRIPGTKISFEARKPWTFFGAADMAVDDVTFVNCGLPKPRNCLPGEFKCKRQFCISPDRLCDFADDCGDQSDETLSTCLNYKGLYCKSKGAHKRAGENLVSG